VAVFREGTDFKDAVIKASSTAPVGSKGPSKTSYDVLGTFGNGWPTAMEQYVSLLGRLQHSIRAVPRHLEPPISASRTLSGPDLGFRVILVPASATASAK